MLTVRPTLGQPAEFGRHHHKHTRRSSGSATALFHLLHRILISREELPNLFKASTANFKPYLGRYSNKLQHTMNYESDDDDEYDYSSDGGLSASETPMDWDTSNENPNAAPMKIKGTKTTVSLATTSHDLILSSSFLPAITSNMIYLQT